MTLNTPRDIELAIQEVKEILEKTIDEEERKEAQEMIEYFRGLKEKPKREGLWSS